MIDHCFSLFVMLSDTILSSSFVTSLAFFVSRVLLFSKKPAGYGSPSGNLDLIASFIKTKPPYEPGIDPLININPSSLSIEAIDTFCVVTTFITKLACHFLPFENFARILTLTSRTMSSVMK